MTSIHVLFFAQVRECIGQSDLTVDLSDIVTRGQESKAITTEQLRDYIESKYPKMQALRDSYIFSINQEYAKPGERHDLHVGDEIAFITPLSGG